MIKLSLLFRLSGVMKVLYDGINACLDNLADDEIPIAPDTIIENEDLEMAIALTEYFQGQRQAYEKV